MIRDRKGFTLVELIVVSVLGAVVLMSILQVLLTNQRTYTAQSAVVQAQQNSRMALEVLFNELREASPGDGDIVSMSSTHIELRLMRKFGIACEVEVGPIAPTATVPTVTVLDNSGLNFVVGDTVVVFSENQEATASDDVWLMAPVVDVDDTETCLGRPAIEMELDTAGGQWHANTTRVGAAVRSVETFRFFQSPWNGRHYLVRRGRDNFNWPLAGPIRPTGGLQFIYRDAMGNITSTPTDVRQIEVRIRTGGQVIGPTGETVSDSLDAWIYTRN